MKSSKALLGRLFQRENSEQQARTRRILRNSTLGIITIALLGKAKFYLTRDSDFEHKIQLVFP